MVIYINVHQEGPAYTHNYYSFQEQTGLCITQCNVYVLQFSTSYFLRTAYSVIIFTQVGRVTMQQEIKCLPASTPGLPP